jgi:hypothetical protein
MECAAYLKGALVKFIERVIHNDWAFIKPLNKDGDLFWPFGSLKCYTTSERDPATDSCEIPSVEVRSFWLIYFKYINT